MRTAAHFLIGLAFFLTSMAVPAADAGGPGPQEPGGKPAEVEEVEEVEEIEDLEEIEDVSTPSPWESSAFPVVDRFVNVPTSRTMRKGSWLFAIDHRARQALSENSGGDFLGFDAGGLKIGLGLRFGIREDLEVGLHRLNGQAEVFDAYEFDLKYRLLEEDAYGIDLAGRFGLTWFYQPDAEDASGFFAQFLVNRTVAGRLNLGTGLLYHSDSSNDVKATLDEDYSVAIPVAADIRIRPRLAWVVEVAANVAGYGSEHPAVSTSLKYLTHRHTFSIVFSNTQYINADGIVSNTWRDLDDTIIGFTITRELKF